MLKSHFQEHPDWPLVREIARLTKKSGGRVLVVGGAVRDAWLADHGRKTEIKDIDLEVYGLSKSSLKTLLDKIAMGRKAKAIEVGKQFGVFNLKGIDIAIPRTDSRTLSGLGRKPKVVSRPELTFDQASARRDLTINSLAYDPLTDEILDAHRGLVDLKRRILRAVDPRSFGDDPLRVLRVMQFAGRYGFRIDPETVKLCQRVSLKHLAKERVGEEWQKMMLKSHRPSVGLEAGRALGIYRRLHPGLDRMREPDWRMTKSAVDKMAQIIRTSPEHQPQVLMFAALCHRLSPAAIKAFLGQINFPKKQSRMVQGLCSRLYLPQNPTIESVRRLAFGLSESGSTIRDLVALARAAKTLPKGTKVLRMAHALKVADGPLENLLHGSDLLRLKVAPGKGMGELLKRSFEEQLKGRFDDKDHVPQKKLALSWIKQRI